MKVDGVVVNLRVDAAAVPKWIIIRETGEIIDPVYEGEHPTVHLRDGDVLGFATDTFAIVVYAIDGASISWKTTVDKKIDTGEEKRVVGPGIKDSETPVRLWVNPDCGTIVLTNGPVEAAIRATERIIEVEKWR